ncbi:hypothetical protein DAI91_005122 [Salmonella enterica subsp. enterica serovar 4,[5],12:i:-]|nr:hypothetical protein [Salmonella enterica subsp. enterica serovar 4,[5],12:i:-]
MDIENYCTIRGTVAKLAMRQPFVLFKGLTFQKLGNDSNLLIVFYVQIMPDDFVMQLHRF